MSVIGNKRVSGGSIAERRTSQVPIDRLPVRPARTLGDLSDRGHATNFNVIRLLAALTVLYSHSFALTGVPEPMVGSTGISISRIALDVFFLTSGFLVTKSLFVRQDVVDFIVARVLRIYPGLIVMTVVTILVAGAFMGPAFFVDPATLRYGLTTAFLFVRKFAVYNLPGVFVSNPLPDVVNGSLWTLPYEFRMYALLAAMWSFLGLAGRRRLRLMGGLIVAVTVAAAAAKVASPDSVMPHFAFMFFGGASFYVLRSRVPMRRELVWAGMTVLVASAAHAPAFFVVYHVLVGYLLFALSYLPKLWRPANDYSYGAYIDAFPIQQAAVLLLPGVTAVSISVLATPLVIGVAALSWHLVEKPSMRLKGRVADWRSLRSAN